MMDFRKLRSVILDAVAREREADKNWGWHVKRINKDKILIRWGYLDYIGQKGDFSIRMFSDCGDVSLVGCMDDEYESEWFRNDDADDLCVFVGDRHWHDAKSVEEGVPKLIHQIAVLAHARY